jgi:hypothetical protein
MIKIYLFILILISQSCTLFIDPKVLFVINNKSDYGIKISFFENEKLIENITILSNQKFERKANNKNNSLITPFNISTDSIVISFDDKRRLIQSCKGKPLYGNFGICKYEKNLIDFVAVGEREKKKLNGNNTISITYNNSDFEKANPF